MPYVITNGDNYLKYHSDNRWEPVKVIDEARVFDSKTKAQNCCVCLPARFRDGGYYVLPFETKEQPVCQERRTVLPKSYFPAEGLDPRVLDEAFLADSVAEIEDFLLLLRDQKPQIEQQLQFAEAQIFDIEHAIEFTTLDASRGYKLYKMLHDARVLRRRCKDSLAVISYIEEVVTPAIYTKTTSRRIAGLQLRSFAPRAIPDIFEQIQRG